MPRLSLFICDARPAEAGLRSPTSKEISFATELVPSPHGDGRAGACTTAGGSPAGTT
jgi:hypothetical protein